MADEAIKVGKVKGLGLIYQSIAPFDKQIRDLSEKGIKHPFLVTPEEAAMIRIAGVSNDFNDFTRTSMAPARVKGKPTILARVSPFMSPEMAGIAVEAHNNNEYPYFSRVFYDKLEETARAQSSMEPEDRYAHILEGKADSDGKFNLTPEMDDTRFILGGSASRYFKQFKHSHIHFYDLPDNAPKNQVNVNYLWFGRPDGGSDLGCGDRGLNNDNRAFGVLRESAKGASKNTGHSLTSVKLVINTITPKTLDALGLSGIIPIVVNPLEKAILNGLRNK